MQPNPVSWFEIYVQDMARARAFYGTVLGVTIDKLPGIDLEMYALPMDEKSYGAGGALVRHEGMPSGRNSTVVYFACADCGVNAARVEPAGGKIMQAKFPIGQYGFIALAYDPDGNLFGLHSMK